MDDYPFRSGPIDVPDGWGYLTRECVSFAAWRLRQLGLPYVDFGNADQWPSHARAAGYAVDGSPGVESVVCLPDRVDGAGNVGHVAWVLAVLGNQLTVEDYNWNDQHTYAEHALTITPGLSFIHTGVTVAGNIIPTGGGSAESNIGNAPAPAVAAAGGSQMAVMKKGNGSVGVFANNGGGAIYGWWNDAGGWHGPENVSAALNPNLKIQGEPGGCADGGADDVTLAFRAAADGKLYGAWKLAGVWHGPLQLPGQ